MKTLIIDIDKTLTDMWPLEREVLTYLLGSSYIEMLEKMKASGISCTYEMYYSITEKEIGKRAYRKLYNNAFERLLDKESLPIPNRYPLVDWIEKNSKTYNFVYATGGQRLETIYVLDSLGIIELFDTYNSIDKSSYPFGKVTGYPYKKIARKYPDSFVVTDSENDCIGAVRAGLRYQKVSPGAKEKLMIY